MLHIELERPVRRDVGVDQRREPPKVLYGHALQTEPCLIVQAGQPLTNGDPRVAVETQRRTELGRGR
jgi:hypothetical protein